MTHAPRFRSLAFVDLPRPDFADVVIIARHPRTPEDPEAWARAIFSPDSAPGWVKALFGLRAVLAPLIGLEGAPQGVFEVDRVEGEEALISADDRHLDFRCAVGVDVEAGLVRVTTAVRLKGWRGRVYFAPVRLLHPTVVEAMLRRAARRLAREGLATGG
ncbi:MAG: DUF2867 domain-containing protein [Actinomycetales bacterium]|nr:DUF2867 domain-containing protein [Actinomycetales bacterium]